MNGIFLTTGFLFFLTLFLLNFSFFHDVVTYWTLYFLLLGGSPIVFYSWYKRKVPWFRAGFLRSYPLRSTIEVPEATAKEYLERYVQNLERVLDSEKDTQNEILLSSCDLVQLITSPTEAVTCGSVKLLVSSIDTAGDSAKPLASFTETNGDSENPLASSTGTNGDFTNHLASSTETNVDSANILASCTETNGDSANILASYTETNGDSANILASYTETNGDSANPLASFTETNGDSASPLVSFTESNDDSTNPLVSFTETNGDSTNPLVSSTETNGDSAKPLALSTETTGDSAKPLASSAETTGDSVKPMSSFTETIGDTAEPGDSFTKPFNDFVKSDPIFTETSNLVLVDITSMSTEEMVSEPNPILCTQNHNSNHNSVIPTTKFNELQNETNKKPSSTAKDSNALEFDSKSYLNHSQCTLPEGSINFIPLEFLYPCLPYGVV